MQRDCKEAEFLQCIQIFQKTTRTQHPIFLVRINSTSSFEQIPFKIQKKKNFSRNLKIPDLMSSNLLSDSKKYRLGPKLLTLKQRYQLTLEPNMCDSMLISNVNSMIKLRNSATSSSLATDTTILLNHSS